MKTIEERLEKLEIDFNDLKLKVRSIEQTDIQFLCHHQYEHCQDITELYDKVEILEVTLSLFEEENKKED